MKNREQILKTNVYDLLVAISENTEACVIRLITGRKNRKLWDRCNKHTGVCKDCLQEWLNEEV